MHGNKQAVLFFYMKQEVLEIQEESWNDVCAANANQILLSRINKVFDTGSFANDKTTTDSIQLEATTSFVSNALINSKKIPLLQMMNNCRLDQVRIIHRHQPKKEARPYDTDVHSRHGSSREAVGQAPWSPMTRRRASSGAWQHECTSTTSARVQALLARFGDRAARPWQDRPA